MIGGVVAQDLASRQTLENSIARLELGIREGAMPAQDIVEIFPMHDA